MRRLNREMPPATGRRGYTLLELLISVTAATVLLGGLVSAIAVASHAWNPPAASAATAEAEFVVDMIQNDVRYALYFTERTNHALTFAVADRNGDGNREIIRYAWSGTPGDPLTVTLNDSTPQVLLQDVSSFDLGYLTRNVAGVTISDGSP